MLESHLNPVTTAELLIWTFKLHFIILILLSLYDVFILWSPPKRGGMLMFSKIHKILGDYSTQF